jgi:hypothetical protein
MRTSTSQNLVVKSFLFLLRTEFLLPVVLVKPFKLDSSNHALLLRGKHVDQEVLEYLLFVLSSVLHLFSFFSLLGSQFRALVESPKKCLNLPLGSVSARDLLLIIQLI